MITFDDAEKQKLSPEDLKKLKQHNDINEWPCPLTDDMKKQMHDSFKVVPKKKWEKAVATKDGIRYGFYVFLLNCE